MRGIGMASVGDGWMEGRGRIARRMGGERGGMGKAGLVPAVDVQVWHLGAVEDGVFALLLLFAVVFEEAEGVFAELDYREDVHQSQKAHADVADCPDIVKGCAYSNEYHQAAGQGPERPQYPAVTVFGEESDVGFSVVVVSYYAGEGEKEYGRCDKERSEAADFVFQGGLGKGDSVEVSGCVGSAEKYDEGGAAADHKGVHKDSKGLHKSLLYRM